MTATIRDEQIVNNASFTATVTSNPIANDGRLSWVLVIRTGAITTTPTLTASIQGSMDGVTYYTIATLSAINSANAVQRTVFSPNSTQGPLVEPFLKVVLTFGGSGNFAATYADLVGL